MSNNTRQRFHGKKYEEVSLFYFYDILSRTDKQVHDNLLGSGPKFFNEFFAIYSILCMRYENVME